MSLLDRVMGRNPSHVSHKLKGPKRLPNESFNQYKVRRKHEDNLLKSYLRGDLIWCAKAFTKQQMGEKKDGSPFFMLMVDQQASKGTYVKRKHGRLKTPRETL